jgi:hypothetical protein
MKSPGSAPGSLLSVIRAGGVCASATAPISITMQLPRMIGREKNITIPQGLRIGMDARQ